MVCERNNSARQTVATASRQRSFTTAWKASISSSEVSADNPTLPIIEAQPSMYPEWQTSEYAWGMVIDLDRCIGCNACVAACNVENNVPVVGKDQVAMGREMQWLRVDRYYTGDVETSAKLLPAGAVHALREGAVRDGLPGPCHGAQPRRPQPDGL